MITLTEMPSDVEQHHHELHLAARECYRLRNEAEQRGDVDRAQHHHDTGDIFFRRALALTAEFEG